MSAPDQIKEVFKAAGYEFVEHRPIGRLIFYCPIEERNIQLWYKTTPYNRETDTPLVKAMDLITKLAYNRGERYGRFSVQNDIKKALGLDGNPDN